MTQNNDDFTYDELNFDGLERRGNYRIIAYREDVLHALDRKDPAAIIYQIVFRWQTEFKKPEVLKKIEERKKAGLKPYTPKEIEDMMYVFMSYNDFVRESGGALGYNTVIRMLDYLINTKKVLYQRENHNPKYADFEYSVNKNAMRELLKALPIEPVFAPKIPKKKSKSTQMGIADNDSGYSTQMGTPTDEIDSTQMGTQSTQTGIASTHLGTEVYPNGGTSHITTHTTHSNHTEGDTVALSDDKRETPTPSFSENASHQDEQPPHTENNVELTEQIAELNRLTNPPSPLDDNIPSTAESSHRIEAETANDEVIHTDTRNTTNSYSPQSTAKTTPDAEPVTEQAEPPATGKGSGKGRGGNKKSVPTTEQYRKVFDTMNEVFRKIYQNPDFQVVESKKAKEAVKNLIDAKGNPALLKLTMFDMWNEIDARGEHWWRKPGRMTVPAIIEQYTSRAPGLVSKLPNHAATKNEVVKDALNENTAPKPPVAVSSSPLGAYSSRPELQPWKDDGAVSDDALNRESWAAIKKRRRQAAGGR